MRAQRFPDHITITLIKERKQKKYKPSGFYNSITINHIKIKGKIMAVSMKDTDQAAVPVTFTDKKNTPLPVGNSITAGSSSVKVADETIATATFDEVTQGLKVVAGTGGVTSLVLAAKDLDGNDFALAALAIEIIPGDATGGIFGTPVITPQP